MLLEGPGKVVVYRARDLFLGRDVAIRTLVDPSLDPDECARLLAEAQAVARLHHPNIASVFDAGMYQGVPFVVMEWVEGVAITHTRRPPSMQPWPSPVRSVAPLSTPTLRG